MFNKQLKCNQTIKYLAIEDDSVAMETPGDELAVQRISMTHYNFTHNNGSQCLI